jgi:hypothetical protein
MTKMVSPLTKTHVCSAFGNKCRLRASDGGGNIDRLNDVEHQAVSRLDNGNNNDDDDVSLARSVSSSLRACRVVLVVIIIMFNSLLVRLYFVIFLSFYLDVETRDYQLHVACLHCPFCFSTTVSENADNTGVS